MPQQRPDPLPDDAIIKDLTPCLMPDVQQEPPQCRDLAGALPDAAGGKPGAGGYSVCDGGADGVGEFDVWRDA